MEKTGAHLLDEFLTQQERDHERNQRWWAERWGVSEGLVSRWRKGDRRIGPKFHRVFNDLPFGMELYYAITPASDQKQGRRLTPKRKRAGSGLS